MGNFSTDNLLGGQKVTDLDNPINNGPFCNPFNATDPSEGVVRSKASMTSTLLLTILTMASMAAVPTALISDGEVLLKHIYDALRTGPQWNETLFIITSDEPEDSTITSLHPWLSARTT
ncbi:hypothetical protein CNMCM6106_004949 [Aspergillus hiratsukae]|uniref:Uncharacterized protein n=1 Tax=Aspergillus hiratsukae TaxID=1194566 RepID=A0A8H6PQB9_9EURO|nr:hypothetical protein CNMCM6106_004949 [Aspergillus hiratsukae]